MSHDALVSLVPDALALARARMPAEFCAVAVVVHGKARLIECANVSTHVDTFAMRRRDYLDACALGEPIGLVHSHCFQPVAATPADLTGCEVSALPWLIVGVPNGDHCIIEPSGYRAPLIGRPFVHGVHDCFSLVRDALKELAGVELPDYHRDPQWWEHGQNTIVDNLNGSPLLSVHGALQPFDVLGIAYGGAVVNHLALYLGDDVMLHHLSGRLSSRERYGDTWRRMTVLHLRHRDTLAKGAP